MEPTVGEVVNSREGGTLTPYHPTNKIPPGQAVEAMARLSKAVWELVAEEGISFPHPYIPLCKRFVYSIQAPGPPNPETYWFLAQVARPCWERAEKEVGQGLIYLAATGKKGISSLEAPVWVCGRNKGGWVRGQQRERSDSPQMWLSSSQPLLRALPLAPDLFWVGVGVG